MATENETLLTRFISLRAPEIVKEEHKNMYFVRHPDEPESALYATSLEDFKELSDNYTVLSLANIVSINSNLYEFATEV